MVSPRAPELRGRKDLSNGQPCILSKTIITLMFADSGQENREWKHAQRDPDKIKPTGPEKVVDFMQS